ncbi:MAG: trigger factor [Clostridia bacterium]|nr:trigger factor [Clostridia bacterium]
MSCTYEKLSSNKAKLSFCVSAEDFENAIVKAYRKNVSRINIPGFRKGKAPRHVIEMQYGKGVFYEDALDELFPDLYSEAVKENKLEVVDRPELDVEQMESGKELKFSVEVYVKPDVELGDYTNIEAKKEVAEVTDDDVTAEIERARERNARFIDVTDRPAKLDDEVNIDYAGFDGDNQFEGGTAKGQNLTLGSGTFIPGFEEQLVGASVGDDVDVNVTFPEEYHEKSLAGKPVVFHVKVNSIKEKELPELNDDFANDMSFDTLDEYKADVRAKLEKDAEEKAESAFENEVLEKVIESCKIDIPDGMINAEVDDMLRDMEMRLSMQGLKFSDYIKYTGQTEQQLRDMYKPQATERVKGQLVLEAIKNKENIEATDEEVDAEIVKAAEQRKKSLEDYKAQMSDNSKEYFKSMTTMKKVIEFLKSNAK